MEMLKSITLYTGRTLEAGVRDVISIGRKGECYTVEKRNRIGGKVQELFFKSEVKSWEQH